MRERMVVNSSRVSEAYYGDRSLGGTMAKLRKFSNDYVHFSFPAKDIMGAGISVPRDAEEVVRRELIEGDFKSIFMRATNLPASSFAGSSPYQWAVKALIPGSYTYSLGYMVWYPTVMSVVGYMEQYICAQQLRT